ncbi:MAG TPA: BON domain-containing protein [Verrucomicrobiae bacterium]|nr:BON domain-containing protein [Verrucomicrobiae bacterium]
MRKLMMSAVVVLGMTSGLIAQSNKNKEHNDVFTPGPDNESQLARQIRHNLLMLPYYSIWDDLTFQLNGGILILQGACPSDPPWDIKKDAENAVKNIPGVTSVTNEIRELPLSDFDWQIRRAEARAIYGDPQIGIRYGAQALPSIHIIVDNGHVTLDGVVDNEFDDQIIRTRANQVPNVFSVTDNLIVLNRPKMSSRK